MKFNPGENEGFVIYIIPYLEKTKLIFTPKPKNQYAKSIYYLPRWASSISK
jgi:uncharacterized protein (DUF1919 family)